MATVMCCDNCKYCRYTTDHDNDTDTLECRYNPPSVAIFDGDDYYDVVTQFPQVNSGDWCRCWARTVQDVCG